MKPEALSQVKYSPDWYLEKLSWLFWKEHLDEREDFKERVNELISLECFRWNTPKYVQIESKPNMILLWTGDKFELGSYMQVTLWWYNVVQSQSWVYVFDKNTWGYIRNFPIYTDLRYVNGWYFGNLEEQWKTQWIIIAYWFPRDKGVEFFDENFEELMWKFNDIWFCELDNGFSHWGRRWEQYFIVEIYKNTYKEVEIGKALQEKWHHKHFNFQGEIIWFNEFWSLVKGKKVIEKAK